MANVASVLKLGMKLFLKWYMLFFLKLFEMASLDQGSVHKSHKLMLEDECRKSTDKSKSELCNHNSRKPTVQRQEDVKNRQQTRQTITAKRKLKENFKEATSPSQTKKPYTDMTLRVNQIHYLIQYDYIDTCEILDECQEMTISNMAAVISRVNDSLYMEGIRRLQTVWGLEVTGYADFNTRKLMLKARCGNADTNLVEEYFPDLPHRVKRYLIKSTWKDYIVGRLTWALGRIVRGQYYGLPSDGVLTMDIVRPTINRACQAWMDITEKLRITEAQSGKSPEIYVYWGAKNHGDNFPFDGPGKVLAHCFYPPVGDLHFDDDETYVLGCCQGKRDLYQITVHELGHGIGLDHSKDAEAIMFPYYDDDRELPQPGLDDITGAQTMYGAPLGQPDRVSPTKKPLEKQDFCTHSGVNAAFANTEGDIWFIRDDMIVQVDKDGIKDGYPQYTSVFFAELEDSIVDATLFLPTVYRQRKCSDSKNCYIVADQGGLYVFVQQKFFFYEENFRLAGANYLSAKFEGVPDTITGAFTNFNTKILLIRAGKVYQLDRFNKQRRRYLLDPGFPKEVSEVFSDIEGQVIGAGILIASASTEGIFIHNYLFTGSTHSRYTGMNLTADTLTDGKYPRSSNSWWFECPDFESRSHQGVFELTDTTVIRIPDIVMDVDSKITYATSDVRSVAQTKAHMTQPSVWTIVLCFIIIYYSRRFHSQGQ